MNRHPGMIKENSTMQAMVTGPPPLTLSPLLQSMCLHTGRKMPSSPPSS